MIFAFVKELPAAAGSFFYAQTHTYFYEYTSIYHSSKKEKNCHCVICLGNIVLYQKLIDIIYQSYQYQKNRIIQNPVKTS
jgi:hypothetical protein